MQPNIIFVWYYLQHRLVVVDESQALAYNLAKETMEQELA